MKKQPLSVQIWRIARWLVPGIVVLGTSCAADLRDAVVDAGVAFVGDLVYDFLNGLVGTV